MCSNDDDEDDDHDDDDDVKSKLIYIKCDNYLSSIIITKDRYIPRGLPIYAMGSNTTNTDKFTILRWIRSAIFVYHQIRIDTECLFFPTRRTIKRP